MATREYMLGEHLPDLHVTLWVRAAFLQHMTQQSMIIECP